MFRGLSAVTIDTKGRIIVPAQYRQLIKEQAEGRLVITVDTEERCLLLYTLPEWQLLEAKLQNLPRLNPASRRLQRLLMGHANELELDRQGRILLPPLLREHASLNGTVMLVGLGNKFELWSEQQWQAVRDKCIAETGEGAVELPTEILDLVF